MHGYIIIITPTRKLMMYRTKENDKLNPLESSMVEIIRSLKLINSTERAAVGMITIIMCTVCGHALSCESLYLLSKNKY